jgi:hypothetical protein
VTITVAAYEWNCPQHTTPRYPPTELGEIAGPVRTPCEARLIRRLRCARHRPLVN